tara:strand:+ start:1509 stop:1766 length:258 start_codon:yes stop_codon:yes gene_type:complete
MGFKMGGWSAFTKQTMQGEPTGNDEAVNANNIKKLSNSSGLSVNVINQIIKDESNRSQEDDFSMSDVKSLVKQYAKNTENADEID